jgi:hypothetical protein
VPFVGIKLIDLVASLVMLVLMTVLLGLAYPLAMAGVAGAVFPRQAAGSLIEKDGKVVGSSLIGQSFAGETLFPRQAVGHDRRRSGGFDQDRRGALQRGQLHAAPIWGRPRRHWSTGSGTTPTSSAGAYQSTS